MTIDVKSKYVVFPVNTEERKESYLFSTVIQRFTGLT